MVAVAVLDDPGMWIVRSLRTQARPVAVVVISSTPNFEVAAAAARLSVVDCCVWPSTEREVGDAVKRAIAWQHRTQALADVRARLEHEVADGTAELCDLVDRVEPGTVQSVLLAVLESRAPETFDHSRRVAQSSVALARAFRLTPAEIRDVRAAALLHDIGKLAIPRCLLSTGMRLEDQSIAIVRRHAEIGRDVLARIPGCATVATLVAGIHERYDGGGYPDGLAGESIPFGARLIAVADAYDAMTMARPYSIPLSHDDANTELVRSAGHQFDPNVVRAWLEMTELARCS